MNKTKRPLKRSIFIGCILFVLLLCVVLSYVHNINYQEALYDRYEAYIKNVLTYTAANIDADDLSRCIRMGTESKKYRELQLFLDNVRAHMDIHYLYIVLPLNAEPEDNMMNVIAAVSEYEYENQADQMVRLNQLTGDSYSPDTARKFLDAYTSGELSFFEEVSEWGDDYTGLLPLKDSEGSLVAALCVDVDIVEIHDILQKQMKLTFGLSLGIGLLFTVLFILWSRKNITKPIKALETGITTFSAISQDPECNPDDLVMNIPSIHTKNEVESLARAVEEMSVSMLDYVKRVGTTQKALENMDVLAHRDSLTQVGNKVAYVQYVESLQAQLDKGPQEFAILMADSNHLKLINDQHGHEKGDTYLIKCCHLLCDTYVHCPVFRTGGDEFVIFLRGRDYKHRQELMKYAKAEITRIEFDITIPEWEKPSIALGMAVYDSKKDRSVQDVINRADKEMYLEKARMKAAFTASQDRG